MSAASEISKNRTIHELRGFIKKVMTDPSITEQSLAVARKYQGDPDANRKIAEEISATTSVHIPEEHSDADKLFLEVLKEIIDEEQAMY